METRSTLRSEFVKEVTMKCGLCSSFQFEVYFEDQKRNWAYHRCVHCDFVFRDPATYLDSQAEKARYETHNNSIENKGYVRFLSPVVEILLPHLNENDVGLDFGSGPGPILDQLFARKNIEVVNYDPYFNPDKSVLENSYDFVTCTEVFEHLYEPSKELKILSKLVKAEGVLLLMTEFRRDKEHFESWGYRTDNTHVCFLNKNSLSWLCAQWGFNLISSDGRISLLQKKS